MKKISRCQWKRLGALPTLLLCAGLLTSCLEKLEQFLPKPPAKKVAPAEQPLTAEEEQAQKKLETANVFSPDAATAPVPTAPVAEPFELNKASIVSILLYHDFVPRIPRTEMMVSVPVFRAQMQALKDANIPVIPMSDVIAWKKGEKNIPDEAVVITLDDGWVGEHEYAFPILKEFGYPFTLYLYKKYVGTGGRSMTIPQIKEMLDNGGELGSHTLSHQPLAMTKRSMTPEKYQEWLRAEIADSKKWLEETFGKPCQTLAYPYGNKSDEIVKLTLESGYDAAVTVNPQKLTWDTPNGLLPRFTQLGDKDVNFKLATNFRGGSGSIADSKFIKPDAVNEQGEKLVTVKPEANSTVQERRPMLEADLSKLGPVAPDSLGLRVSGFGPVPFNYDPAAQKVTYRVPQRLRVGECTAVLTFRRAAETKAEVLSWSFKIDLEAAYRQVTPDEAPGITPDAPAAPAPPAAATPAKAS